MKIINKKVLFFFSLTCATVTLAMDKDIQQPTPVNSICIQESSCPADKLAIIVTDTVTDSSETELMSEFHEKNNKKQFTTIIRNLLALFSPNRLGMRNVPAFVLEKTFSHFPSFSSLRVLAIRDNELTTLPEKIGKLTNLEKLDISTNKLETLPDGITKLQKLEKLDLGFNNLHSNQLKALLLICKLKHLADLNVQWNKLTTVPKEISNLQNLERLVLCSNEFSDLPSGISSLKSLRYLNVRWNKYKFPEGTKEKIKKTSAANSYRARWRKLI